MPKKTAGPPQLEALVILQRHPLKRLVVYRGYGFLAGYNQVAETLHQVLGLPLRVDQNTKQVSFPANKQEEYQPLLNAAGYELGIEDAVMDLEYHECETVILATLQERGAALAEEFYDKFEVDLVSVVLLNFLTKGLVFNTQEGYKLTGLGLTEAKETMSLTPSETTRLSALTEAEAKLLEQCQTKVFAYMNRRFEAVEALLIIRNQKLYRATHTNFRVYLREVFDLGWNRAYQLMRAGEAAKDALGHGAVQLNPVPLSWQTDGDAIADLQPNEAQAAELARVSQEMRAAVFSITAASAPRDEQGRPLLTAPHIRAAANILTEIIRSRAVEVDGVQVPVTAMIDHNIMEEARERALQWRAQKAEKRRLAGLRNAGQGTPLLKIFCTYHQQQNTAGLAFGEPITLTLECKCEFTLNLETGVWKFIRNTHLKGLVMSDDTPIDQF